MILSAFLSAITGLIKYFITPEKAQAIVVWLLGSLSLAKYGDVIFLLGIFLLTFIPLYALRFKLDILSLSDLEALSLGIEPQKLRILGILLLSLGISACVSVSGTIGWIGLLMPHFARNLIGSSLVKLLPASLLFGAMGLYITDFFAKSFSSADLPVGSICAIIGAPLFLIFLIKSKQV